MTEYAVPLPLRKVMASSASGTPSASLPMLVWSQLALLLKAPFVLTFQEKLTAARFPGNASNEWHADYGPRYHPLQNNSLDVMDHALVPLSMNYRALDQ